MPEKNNKYNKCCNENKRKRQKEQKNVFDRRVRDTLREQQNKK